MGVVKGNGGNVGDGTPNYPERRTGKQFPKSPLMQSRFSEIDLTKFFFD